MLSSIEAESAIYFRVVTYFKNCYKPAPFPNSWPFFAPLYFGAGLAFLAMLGMMALIRK